MRTCVFFGASRVHPIRRRRRQFSWIRWPTCSITTIFHGGKPLPGEVHSHTYWNKNHIQLIDRPCFIQQFVNIPLIHRNVRNGFFNISQTGILFFFAWWWRMLSFLSIRFLSVWFFSVCFLSVYLLTISLFPVGLAFQTMTYFFI